MQGTEIPCFFDPTKPCPKNCPLYPDNMASLMRLSERFSKGKKHISALQISDLLLNKDAAIERQLQSIAPESQSKYIAIVNIFINQVLQIRNAEAQELDLLCKNI